VDNGDRDQGVSFFMLDNHAADLEIGYLVSVEGEKCFVLHVSLDGKSESFAGPSLNGVDAVLDVDAVSRSVLEIIDDFLL